MFELPELVGTIDKTILSAAALRESRRQIEIHRLREYIEDCIEARFDVCARLSVGDQWSIRPMQQTKLPVSESEIMNYMQTCAKEYLLKAHL
jgi:hypothetical protein